MMRLYWLHVRSTLLHSTTIIPNSIASMLSYIMTNHPRQYAPTFSINPHASTFLLLSTCPFRILAITHTHKHTHTYGLRFLGNQDAF